MYIEYCLFTQLRSLTRNYCILYVDLPNAAKVFFFYKHYVIVTVVLYSNMH